MGSARPAVILAACILIVLVPGSATTIYSTYDPARGLPDATHGIEFFDGTAGEETLGFAIRFGVSGGDFTLDRIAVALATIGGDHATFQIRVDTNGAPGQVVESYSMEGIGHIIEFHSAD